MTPDKNTGVHAAIADRPTAAHVTEFTAYADAAQHRLAALRALGPGATTAIKHVLEAMNAEWARLTPPHLTPGPEGQ